MTLSTENVKRTVCVSLVAALVALFITAPSRAPRIAAPASATVGKESEPKEESVTIGRYPNVVHIDKADTVNNYQGKGPLAPEREAALWALIDKYSR